MPLYLNLILILIDFTFVSWFYSYIFCFIIDLCSKSLILVQVFWFFKYLVIIYLLIHLFSFDILDAVPICLQFLLMFSCKIDYFADLPTCWFGSPQFFCALQTVSLRNPDNPHRRFHLDCTSLHRRHVFLHKRTCSLSSARNS